MPDSKTIKVIFIVLGSFVVIVVVAMVFFKERAKTVEGEFEFDRGKINLRYRMDLAEPKHFETTTSKSAKVQTAESREEHPPMHKVVDYHNLALNKPVMELFLDVKKVNSIGGRDILLQFDQNRLKNNIVFHEQYSINVGTYPFNLTDGDHGTAAYPADFVFDYVVDLKGKYKLSTVMLDWGSFGTSLKEDNYVTGWELYGQESFSAKDFPSMNDWLLIKKGGIPGTKMTRVSDKFLQKPVRRLRIRARSEATDNKRANWIGICEIEAYGTLMK